MVDHMVYKSWLQKEVGHIARICFEVRLWQWILALGVIIIAVVCVQTTSEFLVALQNRYATYPAGTDTDMYGRSGALIAILSLGSAWLVAYILRISKLKWYYALALILLCSLSVIFNLPPWLQWAAFSLYVITIGASLYTKIVLFVPLVGLCISLISMNSFLPERWCAYELTMYRCPENI